jgi:TPR repeat protein
MNAPTDLQQLRSAASSGRPDAQLALAEALVAAGEQQEARKTLLAPAKADHADAQVALARLSLYGSDGVQDRAEAVDWLLRAERGKHPVAAYLLAVLSLGGVAVERDYGLMGPRLLAAARAGLAPALRALAMYFGRDRSNLMAMRQSESLLAQAAAQRDGVSAALLAERIRHGELVGDAHYSLESLAAVAAQAGINRMPSLKGVPVVRGGQEHLRLDLESSARAPAFGIACEAPRIAMVNGLLSSEECRYIIAMGTPHLARSRVADPTSGEWIPDPIRTSQDVSFIPVLEDFQLRLLQLRMAGGMGLDFTHAEPMVLLNYAPGQEYLPHRDYLAPETLAAYRPDAGQRYATLCCYLNEVEAGGETIFPKSNGVITPGIGRAVAFRNLDDAGRPDPDTLHAGMPVQRGEKWLATLWIRERRYRDF